jgi:hypothetical protein
MMGANACLRQRHLGPGLCDMSSRLGSASSE